MKSVLLVSLMLVGCFDKKEEQVFIVKLSSGEEIECKRQWGNNCGVGFDDCKNGYIYYCQTNVKVLTGKL